MDKFFTLISLLAICGFTTSVLAQCPGSGGPFCYSTTSSVIPVAVDICPDAGESIQVTITAGQVENNFDELQVFCGAAGSGTGGSQIYNAYGSGGNLSGLVFTCPVADDCMSIYINSDVSVTCATNGYTPISWTSDCVPATCPGTVNACYGNNENQTEILEICPDAGFGTVSIEFFSGEVETSFDDLDIYSGPSGSGSTGTQLANDLDGDLTGSMYTSTGTSDCIILIMDSDGSVSCVSSSTIDQMTVCVTSSGALPVTLVDFSAVADKSANVISWETASEFNTAKHIVERSKDGVRDWHSIGAVAAAGFTNELQQYKFMDESPFSGSYYRLRSVDFDGTFQVSDIVHVKRESTGFDIVRVFPQPVLDVLQVQYETLAEGTITYTLSNTVGQVFRQQQTHADDGLNMLSLDMGQLPRGLYFISIDNGEERVVKRVLRH